MEFTFHALQSDAHNVPMMDVAAEIVAEFEPQIMDAIDVFWPKPGWVRTKIHEYRRAFWRNDFQRECMARFGNSLPGSSDTSRKFFGIHSCRNSGNQTRCF